MTTPEQEQVCANCGLVATSPNQDNCCIPITLLFSRASKQVVCVEVGKDFADTLLGFLTLPLSCLVRVLAEAAMIPRPHDDDNGQSTPPASPVSAAATADAPDGKKLGKKQRRPRPAESNPDFTLTAIANVFDSVAKMEEERMSVDKSTLLNAKPAFPFGAGKLLQTTGRGVTKEGEEMVHPDSGLYSCGSACNFATAVAASRCPKHKKLMKTPLKMVEDAPVDPNDSTGAAQARLIQNGAGYVKPDIMFMVTNQLEIYASSSMKALITLEMIRSERVGDLDTMEVFVVADEVLQLLKASLLSLTVLNDVFGKYCSDLSSGPTKPSMATAKGHPFLPECGDQPCCQCSRMGSPLHPSGSS